MKILIPKNEKKEYIFKYMDKSWSLDSKNVGENLDLDFSLLESSNVKVYVLGRIENIYNLSIDIKSDQFDTASNLEVFVKLVSGNSKISINTFGLVGPAVKSGICKYSVEVLEIEKNLGILAKPSLSLGSGNIETSHNFSLGNIDPKVLGYLKSRGLSEENAKNIFIENFLKI